jgi:aspartyl-tRNA(Asn)/glutamyl-tRNA(Gln) amidotransferase subunit B
MVEDDNISDRNAEKLLREGVENPRSFEKIAEEEDLLKAEEGETEDIIETVIENEEEAVKDFRSGDDEALNYIVGQVMSESGGKADPRKTREKLEERL